MEKKSIVQEGSQEGNEAKALAHKWAGKRKHIVSLQKDVELLRTRYDVEEVEEAMEEYASIERSDYDNAEEYQDARDEAWNMVLEALGDVEELEEEEEEEGDEEEGFA